MKITIFINLLLLLMLQGQAQTARVLIQPARPERGQAVTITYDAAATGSMITADAKSVTLVFSYSNLYELPYRIELQKVGTKWQSSFTAPRYATYATFYLQSGEQTDKPAADKHYELVIYDKDRRVMNGYLYEGYSLSAQMGKAPSLGARQAALFEKELSFYPGNYEARIRLLNYKMNQASGTEKEKYREQAHEIIAEKFREAPGKMSLLNKVTMAYLILGENSRLDSIRQVVRENYPHTEVAYELRTAEIGREKDATKKMAMLKAALKDEKTGNASFFTDMHEMMFGLYASKKDVKNALVHLHKMRIKPGPYLPLTLKKIATVLCENGIALDTALSYANKALGKADSFPVGIIRYFEETGYIPSYVPDSTRQSAIRAAKGNMLSLIASIYWKQGKTADANRTMQDAMAISSDQETMANAAKFYTETGRPAKAFDAWWTILIHVPEDTAAFSGMKRTYITAFGQQGLDEKIAELKTIWRDQVMAVLKKERVNIKAPSLEQIQDLSGKPVASDKITNKIIVIDFWATWCVPCMKEMPYLQAVYDKYRNDPRVSFLVINSGARNTLADAQNWPGNKTYSFPVYFNPDPALGDKFGFNVIPATYVIDPAGYIQFKTIGFEGPAIENKLSAAIELLLKESGSVGAH